MELQLCDMAVMVIEMLVSVPIANFCGILVVPQTSPCYSYK